MGRWEPHARARLERAALELYYERGYQQTTVADIAERAGLTERTFFRHFTDKREVLFGRGEFVELVASTVAAAPAGVAPLHAVRAGLEAVGVLFQDRHGPARLRNTIIQDNPELKEREAMKLMALVAGIAEALRGRNISPAHAQLIAEVGVAAFRVAFDRWLKADEPPAFRDLYDEIFNELCSIVTV